LSTPVFSLIVATLGRDKEIRMLLDSLKDQTFKDFEVIIVDQNEKDFIASIISDYSQDLNLRQIRQSEKGASRARNRGLENANGEYVTFPDDDCEYPPDVLEHTDKLFKENQEWDGFTVSSRDKNSAGRISRLATKGGVITKMNILPRAIEFGIFVRASAIKNFFFDEDLGVGAKTPWWSDEGPDFVLRLIERGATFMYVPSIVIYHPNPVMLYVAKTFERSYRYGCGRGRFLKKHHYPLWFACYVFGLYVAGIVIGMFQFNGGKMKYYYSGLKGRMRGYFS
jgi:glycosyltransferase involved in cell wall biosynthesis